MRTRWIPLLLLSLVLPLNACGPKVPPPPPQFEDPNRAPTGSQVLEDRVARGIRLEAVTDEEFAVMKAEATGELADTQLLSDWVAAAVYRGQLGEAVNALFERAMAAPGDQGKLSDALGLAMGHLRWSACYQMSTEMLQARHTSGVFLVRALCLERLARSSEAAENLVAAAELIPMDEELLEEFRTRMTKRSSPGLMPPAPQEDYDRLMAAVVRRGATDRLFVQHLMGRFEVEIEVGTLDLGGVSQREIRQVILSRSQSYRHCYKLASGAVKRAGKLEGSADARFVVGALGQVKDVLWLNEKWGGHPGADTLRQCLGDQLVRLRFPQPRFGMEQLAMHHFSFQPG